MKIALNDPAPRGHDDVDLATDRLDSPRVRLMLLERAFTLSHVIRQPSPQTLTST